MTFLLSKLNSNRGVDLFDNENFPISEVSQGVGNGSNFMLSNIEPYTNFIEELGNKLRDGLTIMDIENSLFLILFVRFIILAIRYNLKTSFYITCIGLIAGYFWYKHLIDIISTYSNVLIKIPVLQNFGKDVIQFESLSRQTSVNYLKLGESTRWYNPGQIIYYAIIKSITHVDSETGQKYYIDPGSMIISKLQNSGNTNIISFYYNLYYKIIPKVFDICSKFWVQLSGVAAYAVITRIGKRYCPYLIRWHWTFLLIIMMIEQIFITFIGRANYFQTQVLIPQQEAYGNYLNSTLQLQIDFLNIIIGSIVLTHIVFLILGLFHAIWGQYFYVPFFVENTELHVGLRPKNSIYSGGNTSWQDLKEKEKSLSRPFPKLWYGWFGGGTKGRQNIISLLKRLINKILKKLPKQFRY